MNNEPTASETMMMLCLMVIARGSPECKGCDWQDPCDKCFAATTVANIISNPKFKKWRQHYRVVLKKKKRK